MSKQSPKTQKAYRHILQIINSDEMSVDDQLPTELELSESLGFSRPTVSKAISLLIDEDIIFKKPGIGSFISRKQREGNDKKMIGLLFPLIGKGEIFRPITEEIAKLSEKMNFSLIWGGQFNNSGISSQQMQQMVDFYISQKVDGILMAPMELSDECSRINSAIVTRLEEAGIPIILVDAEYLEFPERSRFDLVGIDNFRAGYLSSLHYLNQGADRVDFIKSPFSAQTIPQRIMGYQQALLHKGITPEVQWIHDVTDFSEPFIRALIENGARNIICGNDDTAMKLILKLFNLGINVPEEVRVSGFDDLEHARYIRIPLTTVAQPCQKLAHAIVHTMLERIAQPGLPPRNIMIDFEIKIRKSSRIPTGTENEK